MVILDVQLSWSEVTLDSASTPYKMKTRYQKLHPQAAKYKQDTKPSSIDLLLGYQDACA